MSAMPASPVIALSVIFFPPGTCPLLRSPHPVFDFTVRGSTDNATGKSDDRVRDKFVGGWPGIA
jgi:hypothetical protein